MTVKKQIEQLERDITELRARIQMLETRPVVMVVPGTNAVSMNPPGIQPSQYPNPVSPMTFGFDEKVRSGVAMSENLKASLR